MSETGPTASTDCAQPVSAGNPPQSSRPVPRVFNIEKHPDKRTQLIKESLEGHKDISKKLLRATGSETFVVVVNYDPEPGSTGHIYDVQLFSTAGLKALSDPEFRLKPLVKQLVKERKARYHFQRQAARTVTAELSGLPLEQQCKVTSLRNALGRAAETADRPAELMTVDGKECLGIRASAAQVLQLLNSREGVQKKRKITVKVLHQDVALHDLYNAVQAHGGYRQLENAAKLDAMLSTLSLETSSKMRDKLKVQWKLLAPFDGPGRLSQQAAAGQASTSDGQLAMHQATLMLSAGNAANAGSEAQHAELLEPPIAQAALPGHAGSSMQASTQPLLLGPAAAAHDPASLQHISAAVVQTTQCITQRRLFQPQADACTAEATISLAGATPITTSAVQHFRLIVGNICCLA
ncbi:hypothetical protein WJX73_004002 [Symbiochloris irregularis]|uniref:Uncharacterized protein n=1 Tax=Symbiochloris irregularis TaxID=706552 RepID=A0AAW1PZF4_9CHLO